MTRAAEEAEELERMLRERGMEPVRFPCIAFEDGPDLERIRQAIAEEPDFIVVSSPHAARRLGDLMGRTSARTRFAAVGEATARSLPGSPIVPTKGVGAEALLEVLAPLVRGKRVLFPRAERSTPGLAEGLGKAGALVESRILYKTITPRTADLSLLRSVAAITFASGSAVRGFVDLAGADVANRQIVACIGANTAEEAGKAGIRVDVYGSAGLSELCDALALAVSARKG
ncbi:MAG: uroporphyrinogen-III synthase [Myxococcales bacterium]|nr:uroporphyrinogen-III synthase [Myxococcales bacterium]